MVETVVMFGIMMNLWTTLGAMKIHDIKVFQRVMWFMASMVPMLTFTLASFNNPALLKGPFYQDENGDLYDRALAGNPKPSMIVAKMLSTQILQDLEVPKEYKGEQLKTIPDKFIEMIDDRFQWVSGYRLGDLTFTNEENIEIYKAVRLAEDIKKKKENNCDEADRQQQAIDIIERGLLACGTSSKSITDASQGKSQLSLPSTSSKTSGEELKKLTPQKRGARLTLEELLQRNEAYSEYPEYETYKDRTRYGESH